MGAVALKYIANGAPTSLAAFYLRKILVYTGI